MRCCGHLPPAIITTNNTYHNIRVGDSMTQNIPCTTDETHGLKDSQPKRWLNRGQKLIPDVLKGEGTGIHRILLVNLHVFV